MKLKLDLHPIYNDSQAIERSLQTIIDDAIVKRADEIEIIPGKGSGALKKTVLRFLDRPDIKAKYHRLEKDSDNWGRLFVHFRHRTESNTRPAAKRALMIQFECFCCAVQSTTEVDEDEWEIATEWVQVAECPSCGSPNRVRAWRRRQGKIEVRAESGYE